MNKFELFRITSNKQNDPRNTDEIWKEISTQPDFVDSRDCGLVDAVQSGWYLSDTNELFKGFPISSDDVVLDVGCGAGGATLYCANRGAHVVFTDVVAEKIESLKERIAQTSARGFQGIVSSGYSLPVANESKSKVICMEVLEHVENPLQFLKELVRVGQPGALYLLAVPDPVAEKMQINLAPQSYFKQPNHIHIFDREEFANLVEQAGLEIVTKTSYGFFWSFWMLLYWTVARQAGANIEGISYDVVQPPYPPIMNEWASLWNQIIKMPESAHMKKALDNLLPKSQVIIARKPENS
jgi:2-polyprenyl-3-methyl-5-hydroxy-6-metoxy-1,4-benzoquinol methylase